MKMGIMANKIKPLMIHVELKPIFLPSIPKMIKPRAAPERPNIPLKDSRVARLSEGRNLFR